MTVPALVKIVVHRRTGFQRPLRILCNLLKLGMLLYVFAAVPHTDGKRLARRPKEVLIKYLGSFVHPPCTLRFMLFADT